MIHSIGKILSETRAKRGLSIDEAAHATKLRPDKIVALESGDYASFPSNAYARGFLQIYGRFLKVDVSGETAALDTTNRLSVEDYQYLSNAREPRTEPNRNLPDLSLSKRRKPSFVPLLAFFGAVVVALFGFTVYVNWQRITGDPAQKGESAAVTEVVVPEAPAPIETPATVAEVPAAVVDAPASPAVGETPETAPPPAPVAMAPRASVSDREFLGEPAVPGAPAPEPAAPITPVPNPDRDLVSVVPVQVNEVEISVTKRTWVKIRQDDATSAPVFEDYLYPNIRPLKLKGTRFLIEARDPSVVAIRKNGDPIAYQAPGVTIQ
jgi:cytoskeletal protein RodZ